ncbi:MAG: YihY/virulence factor BrkB family protein [Desulfobacteraceae bacterium]|nr:YihY/virulence factor BrkB family protein [Desulfobacteraceae bacterium]
MKKLKTVKSRLVFFLRTDIWRLEQDSLSKFRKYQIKILRILILSIKGYVNNKCALRASALTFYSLLSVVPVAAMAFGIAKGFGFEQRLEQQLYSNLAGQEEVVKNIITFAKKLLEKTKGGLMAGIGVAVLFWSAIRVLWHIESTLNGIWKVHARSFIRRFTDYMTVMVVSPLLWIISSSFNVFITTQITVITQKVDLLKIASPVIFFILKLFPYALVWALFILIYMVMPNTKVRISSAMIAGIIAGSTYQICQAIYISAQVVVSRYNAIYGSFAALPLFLIWLQISWMIVFIGAQVAYAHQHAGVYALNFDFQKTSERIHRQWALCVLSFIAKGFEKGDPPFSAQSIADHFKLSFPFTETMLQKMVKCGILVMVATDPENYSELYLPAIDVHTLTVAKTLSLIDDFQNPAELTSDDPTFQRISQLMTQMRQERHSSKMNLLVKDL